MKLFAFLLAESTWNKNKQSRLNTCMKPQILLSDLVKQGRLLHIHLGYTQWHIPYRRIHFSPLWAMAFESQVGNKVAAEVSGYKQGFYISSSEMKLLKKKRTEKRLWSSRREEEWVFLCTSGTKFCHKRQKEIMRYSQEIFWKNLSTSFLHITYTHTHTNDSKSCLLLLIYFKMNSSSASITDTHFSVYSNYITYK